MIAKVEEINSLYTPRLVVKKDKRVDLDHPHLKQELNVFLNENVELWVGDKKFKLRFVVGDKE